MNSVALSGLIVTEPELHEEGTEPVRCTMRLAVPRHARSGQREPGVVYVDAEAFEPRLAIRGSGRHGRAVAAPRSDLPHVFDEAVICGGASRSARPLVEAPSAEQLTSLQDLFREAAEFLERRSD